MRIYRWTGVLLLCIANAWSPLVVGAETPPSLAGVWAAQRRFGPDLRGQLTIERRGDAWVAHIGGHSAPVNVDKSALTFQIAGARGSFRGERDGESLRGFWIQPGGVMFGPVASPVELHFAGPNLWRGVVDPLEDSARFFLVVTRRDDGTLAAFLRNPERNLGVFLQADRLVVEGSSLALRGRRRGQSADVVLGSGRYDVDNDRISLYFASRGGSYDFERITDDPESDYYARSLKPVPYVYHEPLPRDDGWPTAAVDEVGISQERIGEFVQMLADLPDNAVDASNIHAVLLARHGKLVLEEYFHGHSGEDPHDLRSASKSLTSIMVGNAIMRHEPLTLATPVFETMSDGPLPADLDPRKRAMTAEHLLSMSSGFHCDDSDSNAPGNEDAMQEQTQQPDWYKYTLAVPMIEAPGKRAVYCSANPNLLGGMLARTTHTWLPDYFRDRIAAPMGIRRYHLPITPTGEMYMGGGVRMLPRDFMKFGQVMLDQGVWRGKRIVDADWVQRSAEPRFELAGIHYGFLWWITEYTYDHRKLRAYFAGGNGGQVVLVVPELDLVFAAYGGNYGSRATLIPQREYVPKYILPAIENTH
ncbi:MAG: serine hydrolase [Tahibacter sp.]